MGQFINPFSDVALMDMDSSELFSDRLRLIFLQLPLFKKEVNDCGNDFERWIYVLKNMETLNRLPFAAKSAVFKRLAEITDLASLSKQERMKLGTPLDVISNVTMLPVEEIRCL